MGTPEAKRLVQLKAPADLVDRFKLAVRQRESSMAQEIRLHMREYVAAFEASDGAPAIRPEGENDGKS